MALGKFKSKTRLALLAGTSAMSLAACGWSGPTQRAPALPPKAIPPETTLIIEPVDCSPPPSGAVSSVSRDARELQLQFVHALNTGAAIVRPSAGFQSELCKSLLGSGFDVDWSKAAVHRELLQKAIAGEAARSLLLTVAGSDWHCRDAGLHPGGTTFVPTGGQTCYEERTTLVAMIIDTEGRPLWRSRKFDRMAGPDHAPPDIRDGVLSLYESIPEMMLTPAGSATKDTAETSPSQGVRDP